MDSISSGTAGAVSGSYVEEPGPPGSEYPFVRCLGEGQFGKTYLSHHRSSPAHPLVIKVPHDADAATLLRHEAGLLCSLHHPRIISFRKFIELAGASGGAFLVMEYAAGGSLAGKLAESPRRMPELAVCRYLLHVLQALDYVHKSGVLHLDIK